MKLEKFIVEYTQLPGVFTTEFSWQTAYTEFKKALIEFWKTHGKIVDWEPK